MPPSLRREPKKLVKYLTKPCKTDVERARAVIRWIGENVQCDFLFQPSESSESREVNEEDAEAALVNGVTNEKGYKAVIKLIGQ